MRTESPRDEEIRLAGEAAIAELRSWNERLRALNALLAGKTPEPPRPQLRVVDGGRK